MKPVRCGTEFILAHQAGDTGSEKPRNLFGVMVSPVLCRSSKHECTCLVLLPQVVFPLLFQPEHGPLSPSAQLMDSNSLSTTNASGSQPSKQFPRNTQPLLCSHRETAFISLTVPEPLIPPNLKSFPGALPIGWLEKSGFSIFFFFFFNLRR